MNYEQKYNEALEWMRSIYPTMQGADKEDAEHHFPELKESEDEKIRKEILSYIKSSGAVTNPNWIAWLEKQDEQNTIVNESPSKEMILAVWELGDIWKELTKGSSCTEYETQLQYIQKHWNESVYYEKLQGKQKPIEQDTETHDLWVYIREWNDKFGRLPVDEDELEACINYVMKRQKAAWSEKHIADVFEKVGLAKIVREQGNDQLTNAVQSAMIELSKTAGGFVWKKI